MSDISLSYSGGDMGMSGISTLQFSADCYLSPAQLSAAQGLIAGASVAFTTTGLTVPVLSLGFFEIDKNILRITAYDPTADADIIFDAAGTSYTEYSGTTDVNGNKIKNIYHGQDVLNTCASKLGIGPCSVSGLPDLYYSEFVGKTIREILTNFSECAVGVFYYRSTSLHFTKYSDPQSYITVNDDDHAAVEDLGKKNITHAYVTDPVYDKTYQYGSGSWYNTVSRKGSYLIGQTVCDNVAGEIVPSNYYGWKCDAAVLITLPDPDTEFGQGSGYIIRECRIDFGAAYALGKLGSPAPQQSKENFHDEKSRLLSQKVQTGTAYGNIFIDQNSGLTVAYKAVT